MDYTPHYFVRVNGDTLHNNVANTACFVPGEPPAFPSTFFNYLKFCFERNIVRIGWPDTGDLLAPTPGEGALANCYSLATVLPYRRKYLETFRDIPVGSVILVPDKDCPGKLHICTVTKAYHYFYNVPADPYECAHRLGVTWDRDSVGQPIEYSAMTVEIDIHGGVWRRAFHQFRTGDRIINNVERARAQVGKG